MTTLNLLCAGAAQGLVGALAGRFQAEHGAQLQARFGAVGAMKDALLAGAPCDVLVLTAALIDTLGTEGRVQADSGAALGRVATGLAVPTGQPLPDVATAGGLRAALLAAQGIYFPDAVKSTAGVHFAQVMQQLGVADAVAPRLHPYPNGAAAMREMAAAGGPGLLGCTQVTEILYTPGVQWVAALPPGLGLDTVYSAAVAAGSRQAALAHAFIGLLCGPDTAGLRQGAGFGP